MNTCKTCKHWREWKSPNDMKGDCDSPFTNNLSKEGEFNFIFATDGGGDIPIVTGQEFGCVNHEE